MLSTFRFKSSRPFQKLECAIVYFRHHSTHSENHVVPSRNYIERRRWSDQDTDKLFKLVEEHGRKWKYFQKYFPGRAESSIANRYDHVKHGNTWTDEEKSLLQDLLGKEKDITNIDWKHVQKSLPTKKPIQVIQQYYRSSINPPLKKGKWSQKETEQLLKLVEKHGENWQLVSKLLGTRDAILCNMKYTYEMNYRKRGCFSKEEDEALIDAVNKYGTESFEKIKKAINSERNPKQLRARYFLHLDPAVDKSIWTEEEKQQFFDLYDELKSVKKVKEKLNTTKTREQLADILKAHLRRTSKKGKQSD